MAAAQRTFTCFGGACTVLVEGAGAADAVIAARDQLLEWHDAAGS